MTKKQAESKRLQLSTLRVTKLGFLFIAMYAVSTLIYKLWKLMTPDILLQRWTITLITLGIIGTLWWFSRTRNLSPAYYKGLILLQIFMYLGIAAYSIYTERGMASNSIILFTIPLVIVALEYSGKALMAITALSILVYSSTAMKYFKDFPSEGYKVELYGGIVFYASVLLIISGMLWVLMRSRNTTR